MPVRSASCIRVGRLYESPVHEHEAVPTLSVSILAMASTGWLVMWPRKVTGASMMATFTCMSDMGHPLQACGEQQPMRDQYECICSVQPAK